MEFIDWLVSFGDSVMNFFGFIWWFITDVLLKPEQFVRYFLYSAAQVLMWVSWQALQVAFTLALEFLDSFNYTENAELAWSALPDAPRAILDYCRIPDALSIIMGALGTRFSLKFVPFARF